MAKWRLPMWRSGVLTPWGARMQNSQGEFEAKSADEDAWFREQGALEITDAGAPSSRLLRPYLRADQVPECSADTADSFVFVRGRAGGTLYWDSGESLVQLASGLAAEVAWHPSLLEGLQEGWFADDLIGANASAVRGWIGVNGMTLTQSSGSKRPTLYTTDATHTINGRQVVYLDGTDDLLSYAGASLFAKPTQSIIAIVRPLPAGVNEGALWCSGDEAGTNTYAYAGYSSGGSPAHVYAQRNGDTEDRLTGPAMTSVPQVNEWTSNGATNMLRINHAVQTLTVTGGANNGDGFLETASRDNFTIGSRKVSGETRYWKGDIAALLVLTHITQAERAQLFAWIAANYALGL